MSVSLAWLVENSGKWNPNYLSYYHDVADVHFIYRFVTIQMTVSATYF